MLELGELGGGGKGLMSQEQGVLYYFCTTRTWQLQCSTRKPERELYRRVDGIRVACGEFIIWHVWRGLAASLATFTHSEGVKIMPAPQYLA